jgi:hypothetical protein
LTDRKRHSTAAAFPAAPFLALALSAACSSSSGTAVQNGPDGSTPLHDAGVVETSASSTDGPVSDGLAPDAAEVSADAAEAEAVDAPGTTEPSEGSTNDASSDAGTTAPEAGSTGSASAIETIDVPAAGTPVTFKTSLASGALYLLEANGSVPVGTQVQDAEFASAANGTDAADVVNGTDVGIDIGLLQIHPPNGSTQVTPGPGRMKWFGSFRAVHVYYMTVTGAGQPLTLKLATSGTASSGSIPVSLFLLAPTPAAKYTPMPGPMPAAPAPPSIGVSTLETLQVPVEKITAKSTLTGDSSAIYLLQASGAGTVGGNGLGMGDADYDDWSATGGANNNDGDCDFGIGVDETDICKGPRLRWWGPYRNDHIYYMLYAGTGSPISFLYFDSGYGDNSATDTLTMNIFPTP